MEVLVAISLIPVNNPNLAIQCALLHDTIEDTKVTFEQISSEFGQNVADGVLALTKDKTLPSKFEQMEDSLSRIKAVPFEIWMVKLGDRITNLQPPPIYWNNDKIIKYRDEAKFIFESLKDAHPILSKRLEQKIINYQIYIK